MYMRVVYNAFKSRRYKWKILGVPTYRMLYTYIEMDNNKHHGKLI